MAKVPGPEKKTAILVLPGVGNVLGGGDDKIIDAKSTTVSVEPAKPVETAPEKKKHASVGAGNRAILTDWLVNGDSMRIEDLVPDWSGAKNARKAGEKGTVRKTLDFMGRVIQSVAAGGISEAAKRDEEVKEAVKAGLKDGDTASVIGGLIIVGAKKVGRIINAASQQPPAKK
jgi:hypothetical protein